MIASAVTIQATHGLAELPAARADWLPIDLVVEQTGDRRRIWQWRAQREHDQARAQGRPPLARKAAPANAKGKPIWWLHRSIDNRLNRFPAIPERNQRGRTSLLAQGYAEPAVQLAHKRADWLRRWEQAMRGGYSPGRTALACAANIVREAREVEGEDFQISVRTLQRWKRDFYTVGADGQIRGIAALVDGRAQARRAGEGDEAVALAGRTPEAVDYFYSLYHIQSRPSVAYCHDLTVREARRQGWRWSSSISATRKWLEKYDDRALSYLLREGQDAWCRRYMPYQEIDYRLIQPGELFITDHHQADFWVTHEGQQIRPWLTVVQDARSRAITGWHLGPAPHQDAIIAAYEWAVPENLRIDNGKDFASKLLTGVSKRERDKLRREYGRDWRNVMRRDENLVECGDPRVQGITTELKIETIYAIPYAPWSKGQVERFFGSFEGRCGKTFATYCGRSSMTRPECLEVIRRGYTPAQRKQLKKRYGKEWAKAAALKFVDEGDVPTMDEARDQVAEYIVEYHATPHGAEDMDGMTPAEMWATAESIQRADDQALLFLMQTRGVYRVGPNGVKVKIGGTRIGYGAGCPKLYRHTGRDVLIAVDPNDVGNAFAFTADDRRFIARLQSNERISPLASMDELREAQAAVQRQRKLMRRAAREAPARTRSATHEMRMQARRRAQELKATGTDDVAMVPNVTPVRTGFEGASKVVQSSPAPPPREHHSIAELCEMMGFSGDLEPVEQPERPDMDEIWDAIAPPPLTADEDNDNGTDAALNGSDLLDLIAGYPDERTAGQQ